MATDVRVGPYRIVRLINRGGQGSVFLGYDKRLQRRVAIKIYPLPPQRRARKQLLREAQVIASLDSPRIVQIYDVIESSDHLALVMEYVPGCDLEEFLAVLRPSLGSVLVIAADLAAALSVARQQGVVHGDLKAGNVLIATTGRVKLTDFGIARRPDAAGPGSAAALTPEHCRGQPLDTRSDLFALGCLLYRMLTGTHPFYREGRLDLRMLQDKPAPPLQDAVPAEVQLAPELVELVDNLLQRNPQDRLASPRVVRQVLRQVSRTIPLAAGNSLLAEARPCFRPESEDDLPPAVPAGLGRDGRSRLAPKSGAGRWYSQPRWLGRATAAALVAAVVVVGGFFVLRFPGETAVHVAAPVLHLGQRARLPAEISAPWLVREVIGGVRERLGPVRVSGPIGASPVTTISSRDFGRDSVAAPDEQLELGLRCVELLCVFAVTRTFGEQQANGQAVLFPDMSLQQWRNIVRSTTAALYP